MNKIKTSPHTPNKIEVHEVANNKIKITAYPFESGYAITLVHPLRRLLLGSSVGFAPVALHLDGVAHEFDSIRGVMEDVSLFIVNLKNIRFKIKDDSNEAAVHYRFEGQRVITGADLENDSVSVVTPDAYLATINNGTLDFSLIIKKGIGYIPSEEIRDLVPEGYIPIDAYFTPVTNVTYEIENILVEDDPTFEKMVLNIQTDGQIDALTAFKEALSVMHKQMAIFSTELNIEMLDNVGVEEELPELKDLLRNIDSFNLSARCFNCLDRAGIRTLGELVLLSEEEIKNIKNLGKKSFDEITEKLAELGYPVNKEISEELRNALKNKFRK